MHHLSSAAWAKPTKLQCHRLLPHPNIIIDHARSSADRPRPHGRIYPRSPDGCCGQDTAAQPSSARPRRSSLMRMYAAIRAASLLARPLLPLPAHAPWPAGWPMLYRTRPAPAAKPSMPRCSGTSRALVAVFTTHSRPRCICCRTCSTGAPSTLRRHRQRLPAPQPIPPSAQAAYSGLAQPRPDNPPAAPASAIAWPPLMLRRLPAPSASHPHTPSHRAPHGAVQHGIQHLRLSAVPLCQRVDIPLHHQRQRVVPQLRRQRVPGQMPQRLPIPRIRAVRLPGAMCVSSHRSR